MSLSSTILPLQLHRLTAPKTVGFFFALIAAYGLCKFVYNIFFHPLRNIPGPLLARGFSLPCVYYARSGYLTPWILEAHNKYGDFVRVAPNEVSFISGETAWADIYGHRIGKWKNAGHFDKHPEWYVTPPNGVHSLVGAVGEADHTRMRRGLAYAFSDKALRSQESIIQSHVDLLVHQLKKEATKGKTIDMTLWYNFLTFDVICDLAFGEPLYCLRDNEEHSWISLVHALGRRTSKEAVWYKVPFFKYYDKLVQSLSTDTSEQDANLIFSLRTSEKVGARLEKGIETRSDFFNFIIKNQNKESQVMTRDEIDSSAVLFLVAGSETTATTLVGTTALLLRNPNAYKKLVQEIRSSFTSASKITIEAADKLTYLKACVKEVLRFYPPVPNGLPRITPKAGGYVSGQYLPGGTSVYMSQHAANHSERNFRDPEAFVPERWLDDERYADDKKDAVNPFSFGPRNCLGKNLAYAEIHVTMAKVLFAFDFEAEDKNQDWFAGQEAFVVWQKPEFNVKLTPVQR